jgi:hypothetical protein
MNQQPPQQSAPPRQRTIRLLGLCLASALTFLVGTGCKDEGKAGVGADPVGHYALASVDGKNVPCTLDHEGHTVTVKSGTFTFNPGRTCMSKVVFTVPNGSEANREVKATYIRQGSTLTMQWEGAGTTTGTLDGDTFTMNNEGMVFAYKK